jgi:hypothetical protein
VDTTSTTCYFRKYWICINSTITAITKKKIINGQLQKW